MIKSIIILCIFAFITSSCKDFGNKLNPLYGKVYGNINDIPELKKWKNLGGCVIDVGKKEKNGFGIGFFKDDNENIIYTFEKFLERDESGKAKYKILDTINIGKLKDNEIIVCRVCRQDEVFDSEIIAIVIADDKDVFDRIVKAWRADTKTGRFTKIENLNKITCENEWYGV